MEASSRKARQVDVHAVGNDGPVPQSIADSPDPPLRSYAALMTIFNTVFGGALYAARDRLPERFESRDIVLLGVATHKLSRLITRQKVTAPLRAPFAEHRHGGVPTEYEAKASGTGPRRAIGELLTCPYCIDQWLAAGFTTALVAAPRPTRAVAGMFSVVAIADALQIAYRAAQDAT